MALDFLCCPEHWETQRNLHPHSWGFLSQQKGLQHPASLSVFLLPLRFWPSNFFFLLFCQLFMIFKAFLVLHSPFRCFQWERVGGGSHALCNRRPTRLLSRGIHMASCCSGLPSTMPQAEPWHTRASGITCAYFHQASHYQGLLSWVGSCGSSRSVVLHQHNIQMLYWALRSTG